MIELEEVFAAHSFGGFFYARVDFSRPDDVKRARRRLEGNYNARGEDRRTQCLCR